MTLMLTHQLRVPEVDILRALVGDSARELVEKYIGFIEKFVVK